MVGCSSDSESDIPSCDKNFHIGYWDDVRFGERNIYEDSTPVNVHTRHGQWKSEYGYDEQCKQSEVCVQIMEPYLNVKHRYTIKHVGLADKYATHH